MKSMIKFGVIVLMFISLINITSADNLLWQYNYSDGRQENFTNADSKFTTAQSDVVSDVVLKDTGSPSLYDWIRYDFPISINSENQDSVYLQYDTYCSNGGSYFDIYFADSLFCTNNSYPNIPGNVPEYFNWQLKQTTGPCDLVFVSNSSTEGGSLNDNTFYDGLNQTFNFDNPNLPTSTTWFETGGSGFNNTMTMKHYLDDGIHNSDSIDCMYIERSDPGFSLNFEFGNFELWNISADVDDDEEDIIADPIEYIIENNILGVEHFDLINIDDPTDPTAIMPRLEIFTTSRLTAVFYFAGFLVLILILMIILLMFQIIMLLFRKMLALQ